MKSEDFLERTREEFLSRLAASKGKPEPSVLVGPLEKSKSLLSSAKGNKNRMVTISLPYYKYLALNPDNFLGQEEYEEDFLDEPLFIKYEVKEKDRVTSLVLSNCYGNCFYVTPETISWYGT